MRGRTTPSKPMLDQRVQQQNAALAEFGIEAFRTDDVPVIFSTGYAPDTLPPVFRSLPCLRKPFGTGQLETVAQEAFVGRRGKISPD